MGLEAQAILRSINRNFYKYLRFLGNKFVKQADDDGNFYDEKPKSGTFFVVDSDPFNIDWKEDGHSYARRDDGCKKILEIKNKYKIDGKPAIVV